MRIVSVKILRDFWGQPGHQDAEQPLRAWYAEAKASIWETPAGVKDVYRSADIIANNRVVFNIGGNKYRLIAEINYKSQCLYIRFIGTHAEYDRIDAATAKQR